MAELVKPTPILKVSRKELEMTVRIQTDQDVEIREGDTYQMTIAGAQEEAVAVVIAHANYMTRGLTREWTLAVRFA